jgi:putative flippase GtrA
MLSRIDPQARAAAAQLVRYVVIGGFVTALGAAIYYGCAEFLHIEPLIANLIAFIVGVVIGYFLHSQVSFRGHGARDDLARTGGRFIAVNLFGLTLNSFWVWSLVHWAQGPNWWPIVPMVFVTPLATFLMHRHWTFG